MAIIANICRCYRSVSWSLALKNHRPKTIQAFVRVAYFVIVIATVLHGIHFVASFRTGHIAIRLFIMLFMFVLLAYGVSLLLEWLWKICGALAGYDMPSRIPVRPAVNRKRFVAVSSRRVRGNNS